MKISRWFAILAFAGAILAFVGLSSSTALADTMPDPGWHLCCDGGGATALFTQNDPNFNFQVNGGSAFSLAHGGTGTVGGLFAAFEFINATGSDVTGGVNLDVTPLTGTPTLIHVCEDSGDPYFTSCTVVPLGGGVTEIQFRDPNTPGEGTFAGIPHATQLSEGCTPDSPFECTTTTSGADFIVDVFDVGGDLVHLDPTLGFGTRGFLLPEPSTVLLVLVGLVFLFLFGRARWIPNPNFKL